MIVELLALAQQKQLPVVLVEHDDVVVRESCIVDTKLPFVRDENGDGLLHVIGDDIVVQLGKAPFVGAAPGTEPDAYSGTAISVQGKNVTIRGGFIGGFKAGIVARGADGLVIEGVVFHDMFRQRLKSTPEAEDQSDWLWPHENDADEWLTNYGASIYVTDSLNVTLRSNVARAGQNGICLRRVGESKVYDNDMSWMSGWGLALYRSSKNIVSRNSFDFCIRGYSHGVYARGQDSAGILCFEQSSDNVFAFNSATHGGDGFFGFAGNEALDGPLADHKGVGCNRNVLYGNDFSYAAAIGIEMTFSFENKFAANRLVGSNYGVWGGYSQRTSVDRNEITDNTISGVAVEHGSAWSIFKNEFQGNARSIELWWDEDSVLLEKPWTKANGAESRAFVIGNNLFLGEAVPLELRRTGPVMWGSSQAGGQRARLRIDADSKLVDVPNTGAADLAPPDNVPGKRQAVGALKQLEGRDKIIVTEWGPYDWKTPMLQRIEDRGGAHAWRLLGEEMPIGVDAGVEVKTVLDVSVSPAVITLTPRKPGSVTAYELVVQVPSKADLRGKALLIDSAWKIGVFAYTADPRLMLDEWRKESRSARFFDAPRLKLAYQSGGPSDLKDAPAEIVEAKLPVDHFGTLASTQLKLPAGRWRLTTNSDDGVRVWIDETLMIDNWTWHAPTVDATTFDVDGTRDTAIRVEHFELDGYALLELGLERLDTK